MGPLQSLPLEAEEDILSSSTAPGDQALHSGISAQVWPLGLRAGPADREPKHCYPPVRSPVVLEALRGQQLTTCAEGNSTYTPSTPSTSQTVPCTAQQLHRPHTRVLRLLTQHQLPPDREPNDSSQCPNPHGCSVWPGLLPGMKQLSSKLALLLARSVAHLCLGVSSPIVLLYRVVQPGPTATEMTQG